MVLRKAKDIVCVRVCLSTTSKLYIQLTISTHSLSCTSHPRLIVCETNIVLNSKTAFVKKKGLETFCSLCTHQSLR